MAKKAPSFPNLTDEYEPTNPTLWEKVKQVARGDKEDLTLGSRTITKPSGYTWPSPPASAWAVKQYNGFGGGWRKTSHWRILEAGGIVIAETEADKACMQRLAQRGFTQKVGSCHWEGTPLLVRAALGEDLRRKMNALLRSYNEGDAKALGAWIESNFRINSPKTPRGMKKLKDVAQKMVWVLKHRASDAPNRPGNMDKVRDEVASDWAKIEPHLATFAARFTDEGGTVVPKELSVGGTTYVNKAGLSEPNMRKYIKRLEAILSSLKGWRSKAVKGGLKVVLASPKDFRGTAGGKYKENEDALYVRTTPAVLKRGAGYASFEYILVHELGHRYDKKYGTGGIDFDQQQWWTTKYSRNESFGPLSEPFAELFALGHFDLKGSWDATVDKFEALMAGRDDPEKPRLPPHLQKLLDDERTHRAASLASRWKQALQALDPKALRKALDKAVSRTRDFPTKVAQFKIRKGRGGKWSVEAWIEYKFPTSKIPIQPGKEPVLAPLHLSFDFDPTKAMSFKADVKSPSLGITKRVYENHRITGDYERTIRSVLLSYQPEIAWK